jgi:hypothetical protein
MKLYIIIVETLTQRERVAMDQFLRPFRSKIRLGDHCWLVTTGGTSARLCQEIQERVGKNRVVLVSKWNGDSTWARGSTLLAEWLPRRLASLNN